MEKANASRDIESLLEIMRRLRDPNGGCPWDIEQTFATIAPYTIEEAYEVAGAIEAEDFDALKDELGDLLLQVVYHARMAEELGKFDFGDVVAAITSKMVRRHPHVFGDGTTIGSAAEQTVAWDEHKKRERAGRATGGLLDDVPAALPALLRAVKLQKRAATVGFDWDNARKVLEKLAEESAEIVEAAESSDAAKIEEEVGDLLFVAANLARHLKVEPETALRAANAKFVRRFKSIEAALAKERRTTAEASLDEMEAFWQAAKKDE
jgi:ATP diphosphatase